MTLIVVTIQSRFDISLQCFKPSNARSQSNVPYLPEKNVVWGRGGESYVIIQWEGRALRDIDRGKVHLLLQLYSQPVSQLHSLCAGHTHTHTHIHTQSHTHIYSKSP